MKSYKEMADIILQRRDEYIQRQKTKKRMVAVCVTSAVCGCTVLIVSFVLWKTERNGLNISIDTPNISSTAPSSETDSTTIHGSKPSTDSSSQPSTEPSDDTPQASDPSQAEPSTNHTDNADPTPPSSGPPDTPPVTESDFCIDSIDKINFYSAKKIISEKSLLPFGMNLSSSVTPKIRLLNGIYVEYPIERDRVFTVTMVTYFMIELHNEDGFLAQKLGGTGLVEVVVTQNDLEEIGQIITFKREDRYYSCLINSEHHDLDSDRVSRQFSSHKYIEGFHIVKNQVQENYTFIVHYDGAQVVGFECAPQDAAMPTESTDSVTFVEDFCVLLFTKQYITVDQLEQYFTNENKGDAL